MVILLEKLSLALLDFSKDQWNAFKEDMSEWKQKQEEQKTEQKSQTTTKSMKIASRNNPPHNQHAKLKQNQKCTSA